MSKIENAPFIYDTVGSFLRPQRLKTARIKASNGEITIEELKKIEDEEIRTLVEKQKEAGLKAVTDGEFRRSWWHLDFMWGLNGVEKVSAKTGYKFNDMETRAETARLSGKISGGNHPFVEHFKFLKSVAGEEVIARQTIPAPAQFLAELQREENAEITKNIYGDINELISDIAKAYKKVIEDLYDAGCRNIQFDDCTWGMFCDRKYWEARQSAKTDVDEIANFYVKVNNLAIEGHKDDLVITTHVCRGNYHSTWASSGGYDPIAPILFGTENVSAYYLEYDTERAGTFEALKHVSADKKVVLGLISSKTGKLEEKKDVIERINEASKFIPLERLCLSPQCGFASTEEGNILTEEEQWLKINLVKEVANEVWG